MKKILAILLLPGMASLASAAVIDVIAEDVGLSGGRMGTITDPLEPNDTIGIKIVLRNNPCYYNGAPYPYYDGYVLSIADLGLTISGPGCLDVPLPPKGQDPKPISHPDLTFIDWSGVECGGIEFIQVSAIPECGLPANYGEDVDLVWNMLLHCVGSGNVTVDLTVHGLSEYTTCYDPFCEIIVWFPITEGDLGDLVIYQEPDPPPPPDCWDETQCYGDNNGDYRVDSYDWPAFRDSYYTNYWDDYPADPNNPQIGEYNPCADSTRDGFVDSYDWPAFRDWYYQWVPVNCPIGGTWPPEPPE
jgi:hypothetical protein